MHYLHLETWDQGIQNLCWGEIFLPAHLETMKLWKPFWQYLRDRDKFEGMWTGLRWFHWHQSDFLADPGWQPPLRPRNPSNYHNVMTQRDYSGCFKSKMQAIHLWNSLQKQSQFLLCCEWLWCKAYYLQIFHNSFASDSRFCYRYATSHTRYGIFVSHTLLLWIAFLSASSVYFRSSRISWMEPIWSLLWHYQARDGQSIFLPGACQVQPKWYYVLDAF